MKIAFFDTHQFEKEIFMKANEKYHFDIEFLDTRMTQQTALMAEGSTVVCSFVNDRLDKACLEVLKEKGIKLVALRSAGFCKTK
jgi:D-lactate dehydrogenase